MSTLLVLIDTVVKTVFVVFDDVAALAKKSAAVAIDDCAVTPGKMTGQGLAQEREIPVMKKIVLASLINKAWLSVLLVVCAVSAPVLPHLMLGAGAVFLAYEGAHKVCESLHAAVARFLKAKAVLSGSDTLGEGKASMLDRWAAQERGVKRVVAHWLGRDGVERRTLLDLMGIDIVLSTEILLVSMSGVQGATPFYTLSLLLAVGIFVTLAIYGVVTVLVRLDNVAAALQNPGNRFYAPRFGRAIDAFSPRLMMLIGVVGTLAMLAVAGELFVKLIPEAFAGINQAALGAEIHHAFEMLPQLLGSSLLAATAMGLVFGLLALPLVKAVGSCGAWLSSWRKIAR